MYKARRHAERNLVLELPNRSLLVRSLGENEWAVLLRGRKATKLDVEVD